MRWPWSRLKAEPLVDPLAVDTPVTRWVYASTVNVLIQVEKFDPTIRETPEYLRVIDKMLVLGGHLGKSTDEIVEDMAYGVHVPPLNGAE